MSKKKGTSSIHIPIYERTILVTITKKVDKAVMLMDKDHEKDGEGAEALVIEDYKGYINLIIHPKAKINTICHESFHITTGVLEAAGMELNSGSEEAYTYLIGWVAEKIDKKLRKFNNN